MRYLVTTCGERTGPSGQTATRKRYKAITGFGRQNCGRLYPMPKRSLRIVKRVKNVPVIGICENCKAQFQAEHQPAGQQARAQAVIQQQFNAHTCKSDGPSAGARKDS